MFDQYSYRAKRVIFLARETASARGMTAAIETDHLLDAVVREDQGEFVRMMPDIVSIGGEALGPAKPFLSEEAASAVLTELQKALPPKSKAIPFGVDMPLSSAASRVCAAAVELANALDQNRVEPLHLLAVMVAQGCTGATEVLKDLRITSETVIAAMKP